MTKDGHILNVLNASSPVQAMLSDHVVSRAVIRRQIRMKVKSSVSSIRLLGLTVDSAA